MDVVSSGPTAEIATAGGQEPDASPREADAPARVTEAPGRGESYPDAQREGAQVPQRSAPRGRPPAGTDRTRRTVKDNWNKARTEEQKAKALAAAVRAQMLAELPLTALAWGRDAGVLTRAQYAEAVNGGVAEAHQARPQTTQQPPATPQAAPTASAWVSGGEQAPAVSSGASTTQVTQPAATPETQPTSTPPPTGPVYMGQPLERVTMFAGLALPVLQSLGRRWKSEAFDPTTHAEGVLFRGLPIETKVNAVPVERMAELVGVLAAKRWPATGGNDPSSQAKTELVVLGVAAFGPALATAGKRLVGTLVDVGRGLGARLKSRRPGRAEVTE